MLYKLLHLRQPLQNFFTYLLQTRLHLPHCTTAATELELDTTMSFRHLSCEITSERLLLVVLEEREQYSGDYRHIRATVVRRAVPHVMQKEAPLYVATYNDAFAVSCSGYRVASYSSTHKVSAVYVDAMQLRGQIDTCTKPLNEGRPYANKVNFKPHDVCKYSAKAMFGFFQKLENFKNRHGLTHRDDNFFVELNHLAQFLKITKVLFIKGGVRHCSLADAQCYEEVDIAFAKERIDAMLAPFLQLSA